MTPTNGEGNLTPNEAEEMSAGREHAERRAAQAAAARKRPVKRREDIDWKREEQ